MSQGPPPPSHDDHPEVISRNARYGIVLFLTYSLIYASFVALSAFAPTVMAKPVLGGVNLAVACGFGLIILAFVLALLYMYLCGVRRGAGGQG
jgi:uncharacterized membrane protein (DUF485 family)